MKRKLISWVGRHDFEARDNSELGAIANIAVDTPVPFDEIHLLVSDHNAPLEDYCEWLHGVLSSGNRSFEIITHVSKLSSPINYQEIYRAADSILSNINSPGAVVTINLTSGTPAMTAIWLLLGQGVYNTLFVQSSREHGREVIQLPFDISFAYIQEQDKRLKSLASDSSLDSHFDHMPAQSEAMKKAIVLAKKIAPRNLPVIIQGETGTGKEVMARAMHNASSRSDKPFIAVNCGAIPDSLIDSELFGHKKGSFTGADQDRKGHFEEADGGTLFLDELGELPMGAQVKLLRALQEGQITRVGESNSRTVNVRIIAATHRNLLQMMDENTFREDLFYRLAVGVITLPNLRERQKDIESFVDLFMDRINDDAQSQPGYVSKNISQEGKDFIINHHWPGNIRELWNTLLRASIWSDEAQITLQDIHAALIERTNTNRPIDVDVTAGVNINQILDETKSYLIKSALESAGGQKKKAAKLLGLSNHQTLTNWMEKLGVE